MSRSRLPVLAGAILLILAFSVLKGQEGPKKPISVRSNEMRNGFGRIVTLDLDSAPFPDAARRAGYSYDGDFFPREGHYDDPSVTVFIPKDFEPKGRVDLVFFFHGWYSSVSEAAQGFALFRQFSASGARALLVLPETARDAPDSFAGKLEREDGFANLVMELLEKLYDSGATPRLKAGSITLAGHSGAYHVISRILAQKGMAAKVGEVCLFDALYEDVERYSAWIREGAGRFVSICSQGGGPEDNARGLAASLSQDGIEVRTAKDDPQEDARALGDRVVFITSPYGHGELISQADEFRRVLAAASPAR